MRPHCGRRLAWRRWRWGAGGGEARVAGVARAADLAHKCAQAWVSPPREGGGHPAAHGSAAHVAASTVRRERQRGSLRTFVEAGQERIAPE